MANKIGVVGEKSVVIPFQLIGIDAFPVQNGEEARQTIQRLEEEYGVIYLTESIAEKIPDTIAYYDTKPIPAIVLIPSSHGSLGIGQGRVHRNIEKAIGQDILKKEE